MRIIRHRRAINDEPPLTVDELNQLGKIGWLLTGTYWVFNSSEYPMNSSQIEYIFARAIEE